MHKYDPVIVDGKLARLSVSQLMRFIDCPRKWWYSYVGGIKEPDNEAFRVGKDGHKRFELYYAEDRSKPAQPHLTPDDVKALPLLPATGTPEQELKHLSLAGIPFQGSMDLVHENNIYDYKFQSRISRFAEPTAQAWGYLEELRRAHPEFRRLLFHYILISKKGADPVKQTFEYDAETVRTTWLAYTPVVEQMKLAVAKAVGSLEAKTDHCYKYGPCPYMGICDRGTMSFLDELNKAKAELAAVELPEVKDGDEPSEAAKTKALAEAAYDQRKLSDKLADQRKSIRPPEVIEPELDDYARPPKGKTTTLKLKTVEVRHTVTLDIKRDGVFSASIGLGMTAECDASNVEETRKLLSGKILDAIKNEAERYKKGP